MREKIVEAALVKRVKELGGLCEKHVSLGNVGVPDRIVTLPGGTIIWVELKAPGKEPTVIQLRDHDKRRKLGCEVIVIDSLEGVDAFAKRFTSLSK